MWRTLLPVGASLAVAALLVGSAGADQPQMVAGGGSRPDGWGKWEVAGTVVLNGGGGATGHFTIVRLLGGTFRPTVCRYDTFTNVSIAGDTATFDAEGVCRGENEFGDFEFAATNHFTIVDNGEPGTGVDTVDVNFLGPSGIAVPGGVIDSGNFQVSG
jgi:hypothetical protein